MINIHIEDETAPLEVVILGTARELHSPFQKYVDPEIWPSDAAPEEDMITDPKSRYHLMEGTFPVEVDLRKENDYFSRVLAKYNVEVYKPITLTDTNQIFTRDIGFVVDDVFIKSNMGTKQREQEFHAIRDIISNVAQEVWFPPATVKVEGGDVFPYKDKIFVGQAREEHRGMRCDRTNEEAIRYLSQKFPHKEVIPIYLNKSDRNPYKNCLHLDCAFQPLRHNDHCIVHPQGFADAIQCEMLIELFGGRDHAFVIDETQMYHMNSNVFSISPDVVVSGSDEGQFGQLNAWLKDIGLTVETVPYSETAKMEGLFRCSTLPLKRKYNA